MSRKRQKMSRKGSRKLFSKTANYIHPKNVHSELALKSIGLEVQGLIQDSIKNGNWEKNADSTIIAKNGSGQPLIDTGSMLRAVSCDIVTGKQIGRAHV